MRLGTNIDPPEHRNFESEGPSIGGRLIMTLAILGLMVAVFIFYSRTIPTMSQQTIFYLLLLLIFLEIIYAGRRRNAGSSR